MATDDRTEPIDWGIEGGYLDGLGQWREPDAEVTDLLQQAMGRPTGRALVVVRPGDVVPLGPGDLALEDGTSLTVGDVLPNDLPLGYHHHHGTSGTTNVIVSPGRCHLPAELHSWGVTAQLYAALSSKSWGIGDLGDLRHLIDWARERHAGVVGLNPLHAPTPLPHPSDSPYSPSSRRFRDPLYLAMEDIPGANTVEGWSDALRAGRELSAGGRIDRTAVWAHKRRVLEQIWATRTRDADEFHRFRVDGGPDLEAWGTFCALADHHGTGWPQWPDEHRHPDHPAVARFARDHADRVGFWSWLQWLLDTQLAASGAGDVVIADLAVGFAADGFDAWQWQDLLAEGVRIGAPPDPLGREG
ncbi:MAG: 4-alpha-glucanotransferase, partial [Aquihabitans sp.]